MTPKNVVTSMAESSCFRTHFGNRPRHGSQTLVETARRHFYSIFSLIWDKLSYKTSFLVRSEILGFFGNTLTTDHMYSRHNWDKLTQQVQTSLSQKPKTFCEIFLKFLKCRKNFAHFQKKDQLHGLNISEVIGSKKCGYLNGRKLPFQNTLRQSTCSRVPNNDKICTATLSS